MTEIGPGPSRSAFQEAAVAATEAAAAEQLGHIAEERERDEQGRFVPAETATEETPAVEVPAAVETPDERDARIAALEAQLLEKESFIGRQSSEIGELRSTVEERLAAQDARLNTPTPRQITPDLIEQNPGAAAQLAYEQGDSVALGTAYQQWAMEDPAAAATWVAERRGEERERALRTEFEQRTKALEDRFTPIQQQQEQTALTQSVASLPDEVRAFLADATTVQALANEFPTLGSAIVSGSPAEKLNAIQALHGIHRGRTADTLTQEVTDVARQTAKEAQAVRDEAHVAGSSASEGESLTWEQQEQQRLADHARQKSVPFGGGLVIPAKQ